VRLGDGCVVGAGAVVTHSVEPGEVVVGVPAHPMRAGKHELPGNVEAAILESEVSSG
jgi:acetyltransferase-like isoleucine patch superfamily enzyme